MKIRQYLNEDIKDYKTLVNMVAIVSNKKDLEYITDVVNKSLKAKMITNKQHKNLHKEIKSLGKGIK